MPTVANTIKEATREHLENGGLLFGQCLSAVGWVGGTVPQMEKGIVELSMADSSGAGIAVGAALAGRRPIYVIRYQGFMWYDAAPLMNYAAKSMDMWGVPCPIFIRAIAMDGAGPVAGQCHHGLVMRMPGIKVIAPMSPLEWMEGWTWFLNHDSPLYVSEHRKSFPIDYENRNTCHAEVDLKEMGVSIFAISYARHKALEAILKIKGHGYTCDLFHLTWLKPFTVTKEMVQSLKKSRHGLVIDCDFDLTAKSIAHDLMLASGVPVHAMGLEDRTAGFGDHDNMVSAEQIVAKIKEIRR